MGIVVSAPGSCGELVQGTIDGKNFLVTCPVDLFAEVELYPGDLLQGKTGHKVMAAVERTLLYLGAGLERYHVAVRSELPVGKGMASSSADISAACLATALSVGRSLSVDEIADIALSIEPTDAIFYPGIALFDHIKGRVRQSLGNPPPMRIVVFDVGGEVDTVSFNQRQDLAALNAAKEPEVRQAVEWVTRGIATGDCRLIGAAATLSARANQPILYKPCLETIIEISGRLGAVGVNVAHSGTVVGVLFPPQLAASTEECIRAIGQACPAVEYVSTVNLISGGLVEGGSERDELCCQG